MNLKAICAEMAFYRMHNVKRIPTGPLTPWPNRAEIGVRRFKNFLLALVDTASKNLDQTTLKGSMAVVNTSATIFQADLEELPDSRERAGVLVLWLSCEGQIDVWEMFSDNSYLKAILDRQGLQVAAPIELRTKKAESYSPQLIHGFWQKLKKKNPKIVAISPTFETKDLEELGAILVVVQANLAVEEEAAEVCQEDQEEHQDHQRRQILVVMEGWSYLLRFRV